MSPLLAHILLRVLSIRAITLDVSGRKIISLDHSNICTDITKEQKGKGVVMSHWGSWQTEEPDVRSQTACLCGAVGDCPAAVVPHHWYRAEIQDPAFWHCCCRDRWCNWSLQRPAVTFSYLFGFCYCQGHLQKQWNVTWILVSFSNLS